MDDQVTGTIVLVEDEAESRKAMTFALRKKGHQIEDFANGADAIRYIQAHGTEIDLVITDLRMPGVDGLTVLRETKAAGTGISVILVTAHGSVDSAVEAMKLGADDYLTKPVDLFEFRARVSKLLKGASLNREVELLHSRLDKKYGLDNIVGSSACMEKLFEQVRAVASTNANVLIVGESGTGKELIANAIHQHSKKRNSRFLPINCAAIPSEILESELFGHERGSFTGAIARKIGKFELASQGTIFLDEIGDMSLDLQVKLLRVLENREFMRVGGSEMIKLNSRFVFATNKNLEEAIDKGDFREDLYYRINVVSLRIPPLRERREDIPLLIRHYLSEFTKENGREMLKVSAEVMEILMSYRWPGNVRELKNLVENVSIFCVGDTITPNLLPAHFMRNREFISRPETLPMEKVISVSPEPRPTLVPESIHHVPGMEASVAVHDQILITPGMRMDEIERMAIFQALSHCGNNKTKAADLLGIGLRTLQRKLKEYGQGGEAESEEEDSGGAPPT